jgi:anti-sigma B factor antagonist
MDRQYAVISGGRERPYASETEFIGQAGVVAVSGEMDLHTAPQFKRDLDEAIALTSGDVILDLSDVDLIDSTSICVMLGAQQRLEHGGRWLVLVVAGAHVLRILAITGLQTAFPIVASRREALLRVVGRLADPGFATSHEHAYGGGVA